MVVKVGSGFSSSTSLVVNVPSDKGIASCTFEPLDPNGAALGSSYSSSSALFANGVAVSIGSGMTVNGTVYGGSDGGALEASTSIVVEEGATVKSVYGGSRNGNLKGDTSISVQGTVSSTLAGGGHAVAKSGLADAVADVDGSTIIFIGEAGGARYVHGAGRAESPTSGSTASSVQANVSGSATLRIAGATEQTNGGGYAGPSSYAYSVENTQATANLGGNANIVFEATAASYQDNRSNKVYGGGWAQGTSSLTNTVVADVGGNTSIEALLDDSASSGQPSAKSFNALYGGGYALYRNAQANVQGDTSVKTARPSFESREGIAGGGYASWGAASNVEGTTHVEVFSIEGQVQDYENANLVVGGGIALCGVDGGPITQARSGATSVVVHEGARLTSGSFAGTGIVGGGYALSGNANVDVAGQASIVVEDNVTLQREVVGGGATYPSSAGGGFNQSGEASAKVGNTRIVIGDNCSAWQNVIGGGRVMNTPNVHVDVGATSIEIGKNSSIGGMVVGGGFLFGSNAVASSARVLGDANTVIGDGAAITGKVFVGDNSAFSATYTVGGGCIAWSASSCDADVVGTASTQFGNGVKANAYVGGGFLYQAVNGSANCGSTSTVIGSDYQNLSANQWSTAAGRTVASTGSACAGDASSGAASDAVTFRAGPNFTTFLFAGAGIVSGAKAVGDTDASVFGDVATSFETGTIDWLYGGSYRGGDFDTANIEGSSSLSLDGTTVVTTLSPSGTGSVSGEVHTTLRDVALALPLRAEAGGKVSGNQTFTLVGSVSLPGKYLYADHAAGTVIVEAGDESGTETTVDIAGIYAPQATKETPVDILVHRNANLKLLNGLNDDAYYLTGAHTIHVAEGGTLSVMASTAPATIFGDLLGAGTIVLPAGGSLAGEGKLDGDLALKVIGDPAAGQTYFSFSDESAGRVSFADPTGKLVLAQDDAEAGRTKWTLQEQPGVTVVVEGVGGASGSVTHAGAPLVYTLTPDYGCRIGSATLDGTDVDVAMIDLRSGTIELSPAANGVLTVTFVPLESEGAGSIIDSLPALGPDAAPSDEEKSTVLDAKLDYESMPEEEKKTVGQDRVDKLNDAIANLPEVHVEVELTISTELGSNVTIPEEQESRFIGAVGKDEIEALKKGEASLLRVVVQIASIDAPDDEQEQSELEEVLGTHKVGQHFSASVTKQLFAADDPSGQPKAEQPITALPAPVQLTFEVPAKLLDRTPGTERTFDMVRTHRAGEAWKAELLGDKDDAYETVTVSTDKFSTYSIVYLDRHTVTFMDGSSVYQTDQVDDGATAAPPADNPAKSGFAFDGWCTDAAGENPYDFAAEVHAPLTLYAAWSEATTPAPTSHTVSFAADGVASIPSQTVEDGLKAKDPGKPARDGYDFDGWFVDGAQAPYDFNTPVTGDLTLQAKWTRLFTVAFEADEGLPAPSDQTVRSGELAERPANPEKDGCSFAGWFADSGLTTEWDFATDTVTEDTTLYAKWEAGERPQPKTHEVAFIVGRGGSPVEAQQVLDGERASEPPHPQREGYTFAGWCSDVACTQPWNFDTPVTGGVTLYAKWTENAGSHPEPDPDPDPDVDPDPSPDPMPDPDPVPEKPDGTLPDQPEHEQGAPSANAERAALAPTGDPCGAALAPAAIALAGCAALLAAAIGRRRAS